MTLYCVLGATGVQDLVNRAAQSLDGGGVRLNPEKCQTLLLKVDKKGKKWFMGTVKTIWLYDHVIGLMSAEDHVCYLGLLVGPNGMEKSNG